MGSRWVICLGLVTAAAVGIACEDDGGRPGEISFSVTVIPSSPFPSTSSSPGASPSVSPDPSKSPGKPNGEEDDQPEIVKVPGGADLMTLPEKAQQICAKGPPLRRACPALVPAIKKNRSYVIDSFGRPGGRFQVLEMAAGAPGENIAKNAPPDVAHVVVEIGKPGYLIDLGDPVETSASLDSLLGADRSGSQLVSPEKSWRWDRPLVLAESFPGGGAHGDHLIYSWEQGTTTYRVSLHAWTPGAEAVRTLQAIVKSIR